MRGGPASKVTGDMLGCSVCPALLDMPCSHGDISAFNHSEVKAESMCSICPHSRNPALAQESSWLAVVVYSKHKDEAVGFTEI